MVGHPFPNRPAKVISSNYYKEEKELDANTAGRREMDGTTKAMDSLPRRLRQWNWMRGPGRGKGDENHGFLECNKKIDSPTRTIGQKTPLGPKKLFLLPDLRSCDDISQ